MLRNLPYFPDLKLVICSKSYRGDAGGFKVYNFCYFEKNRNFKFFTKVLLLDPLKRFKKAISKRRNYKTNVILLSVRKKVFLNEPIVTFSENILLEIRCQHTRRARKHVLLEFLCKQSKSSL